MKVGENDFQLPVGHFVIVDVNKPTFDSEHVTPLQGQVLLRIIEILEMITRSQEQYSRR